MACAKRQPQLPLARPGVFILPSLPTPRISCSGMIAMRATEISARRIRAQFSSSQSRRGIGGARHAPSHSQY